MGIDAMGYTLALVTIGMSMIAAKNRSMPITIGTAALWAAFLSFMVANNTAGLNWLALLIIAVATFIIAFALLGVMSNRLGGVKKYIGSDTSEGFESSVNRTRPRGIMDLSTSEYRATIRNRMRRK